MNATTAEDFSKRMPMRAHFHRGQRIYFDAWVEEGWGEENTVVAEAYKYYNKVIVRDYEGKAISRRDRKPVSSGRRHVVIAVDCV